ncbi:hypothetical protein [Streptomyces sp. 891-h]|uniref:hypothetical protein n=1 Tax=Streptomyces sp. 891-h TaxID=2720714 RepID=UPI001FA9A10F|nr:hypothetical protein [Streptomyces sp. 891-h]UNZ21379.1 hypothetical protein HC362_34335 [Streptomyces sp. 891-h]
MRDDVRAYEGQSFAVERAFAPSYVLGWRTTGVGRGGGKYGRRLGRLRTGKGNGRSLPGRAQASACRFS